MPNIVLNERDMTTVAYANDTNDVVFVPGIADTNWNVWITDVPGATPNDDGIMLTRHTYIDGDTIHHKKSDVSDGYPSLCVNTFDKKMWKCNGSTEWELMTGYTAPAPMNVPTYVRSTTEFASKFGSKPFVWKASFFGSDTSVFDNARKLPIFAEYELPGSQTSTHYFYNNGDEEISWIYANDLIYAGMPVVFEDVARIVKDSSGTFYRKAYPMLTNESEPLGFYEQLNSQKTGKPTDDDYDGTHGVFTNYEMLDMSEFNFKYVTSGGYPVFNSMMGYPIEIPDQTISAAAVTAHQITLTATDEVASVKSVDIELSNGPVINYKVVESDPVANKSCTVEIGGTGTNLNKKITVTFADDDLCFVATSLITVNYFSKEDVADSSIVNNMFDLCAKRGDCYALIDHADNVTRPWYGEKSLKYAVENAGFGEKAKYAGMMTPWATYSIDMLNKVKLMPGSFGYLRTLARGAVAYHNYFAFAGVNRGVVYGIRELHCMHPLTNTVANDLQTKDGYSINPITYVRPYGLTLWGNRTLLEATGDLKATNFLNIRNLVCEVQKTAYQSAKTCLFENDNLGTWVKFSTPINSLLRNMQNAGALQAFEVVRKPVVEKAVIAAEIRLVPIYAVEEFWITVTLLDNGEVTTEVEE